MSLNPISGSDSFVRSTKESDEEDREKLGERISGSDSFVRSIKLGVRVKNCAAAGSNYRTQVVTCRKKEIHPQFYEDAKVNCNGELVMTTGGTQKGYVVDVWSGNHPFYLGGRSALVVDADQVEKSHKKFGGLSEIMEIPVLKGEIVLPRKSGSAKGGKKK